VFVIVVNRALSNQTSSGLTISPSTASPPSKEGQNISSIPSNVCSSVTITRIDMSSSQKLPSQFDNTVTPGIGSPQISGGSNQSTPKKSSANSSNASLPIPITPDSSSGITITPIVMENAMEILSTSEKKPSILAKLEEEIRSKEERKKDKERRKELKKEKKKEKKDKARNKEKGDKKDRKEKQKKKKDRDKNLVKEGHLEAVVPKLTLKLTHSNTPTPVDSPNPPPVFIGGDMDSSLTRKITIKPIEEKRSPSPELARFSPLVTRFE